MTPRRKKPYNALREIFFDPKFFLKRVFDNFRKSQKKSAHSMCLLGNGVKNNLRRAQSAPPSFVGLKRIDQEGLSRPLIGHKRAENI